MLYMNTETLAFGLSFDDAKRQTPQMSIPVGCQQFGEFLAYEKAETPVYDRITEQVVEVAPMGGIQQWKVVALPDETVNRNRIREATTVRNLFKAGRAAAVAAITVEVGGMIFQGDETSQTRMTRSISVMGEGETILWVLADNTPAQVTKAQLVEALRLAGAEQARLWVQV